MRDTANPWRDIFEAKRRLYVPGPLDAADAFGAGLVYGAGLGALLMALLGCWL